jgi:hypothetical protein
LDFSSSNWIFFINRALTSQRYTVKFPSLYFWTSSTNFWSFSGRPDILFSLLLFFWYIFWLIFFFSSFLCGDPKMGYNRCPLFTIVTECSKLRLLELSLLYWPCKNDCFNLQEFMVSFQIQTPPFLSFSSLRESHF